jgi:acetyl-CoA acetyltransferase
MPDPIAIVGVGETEYVRRGTKRIDELAIEASLLALADAGIDPSEVDGIVTEAALMPHRVPPDEVAVALGVRDRCFTAHGNVIGAGIVGAPSLAAMAIQSGKASVVLSYFAADLGSSAGGPYAFHAEDPLKASLEMPFGWYGQPTYFASWAQRYKHEFGLTSRQQAAVAMSARRHAALTPGAMKRAPFDYDEYLASPMISEPLRMLDCCLINDGGTAFVMTSLERARDLPKPPVVVAGCGIGSKNITQSSWFTQNADYLTTPAIHSAPRAYAEAGLTPADVDFAEIYDCFTITTLLQLEDLGFCAKGEAASFVEDGRTGPGGAFPVNTHGGLLSHSYMQGANHVVEAVHQLRGERGEGQVAGAEVGLVAGLGVPDHATLLLTVDR